MNRISMFRREVNVCEYSVEITDGELSKLTDPNVGREEKENLCEKIFEREGFPEVGKEWFEEALDWHSIDDAEYRTHEF